MFWNVVLVIFGVLFAVFLLLSIIAFFRKPESIFRYHPEQRNPIEGEKVLFVEDENDIENADGVKGHLEAISISEKRKGFYENVVKRALDIVLSFGGLIVLSPVFLALTVAIKIDDPGPAIFKQKRVGKGKVYFYLLKFRSMKTETPHEMPTRLLTSPEQYITRVGKFIRKYSLDELPQIFQIFTGKMSIIGPRPVLWNEQDLIKERDKYGANDIRPGLTGWAQINGRDVLKAPEKAKLDGEYTKVLKRGGFSAFALDCKCFMKTILKVIRAEDIVEGGTGNMKKEKIGK